MKNRLHSFCLFTLLLPGVTLAQNPELLIQPQGLAQSDGSIRGGSYPSTKMLINGIALDAPYSAHQTAAFPIAKSQLSAATVQTGSSDLSGGLVGASTQTTLPLEGVQQAGIRVGTEEDYQAFGLHSTTNLGVFIDVEKAQSVDVDANDLERYSAGAVSQFLYNNWQIQLLGSGEQRNFGAQGYYGIPATVYAEEQTTDALLLASALKGDLYSSFIRAGVSVRGLEREYRIPSAAFENQLSAQKGSLMAEGRTLEIQNIALFLRGEVDHERLSGDPGNHQRSRADLLIFPEARYERVTFRAGLNSTFLTAEAPEWLPRAGIDFFATDNLKLYIDYTEAVQQPDFEMLYYVDPYHTANSALKLQHTQSSELGLHQFISAQLDWRAALFHRRLNHAADWIKTSAASPTWTAVDLGSLDVYGADAKLTYQTMDGLNLQLYYQWITKDEVPVYAGLYELDYPEHLLGFSAVWSVTENLQINATQTIRKQEDHAIRTSNDVGAETSLGLQYTPRSAQNVCLSFRVDNLLDSDFQAIPGLNPRGRTASAGITVNW